MGQEAACTVHTSTGSFTGTALLESSELLFRGGLRLKLRFDELDSVEAVGGRLVVHSRGEVTAFELGPRALTWSKKILNPPTLLDKLGVKAETRIAIAGAPDQALLDALGPRAAFPAPVGEGTADLVFLAAGEREALGALPEVVRRIRRDGGIWIVYPKGVRSITEGDVLIAGRAAGLRDVKVASFSTTHTALKFVIPLADR
jgi:hypothetical protein